MHLAARVLAFAIVPSIASAQTESRHPSPATPQATSSLGRSGSAASPRVADTIPQRTTPARVLVLDCPPSASTPAIRASLARERLDTLGTAHLVAQLCARAQSAGGLATAAPVADDPAQSV